MTVVTGQQVELGVCATSKLTWEAAAGEGQKSGLEKAAEAEPSVSGRGGLAQGSDTG